MSISLFGHDLLFHVLVNIHGFTLDDLALGRGSIIVDAHRRRESIEQVSKLVDEKRRGNSDNSGD